MATALTLGRLEPNKDSVGGLKAVYFFEFSGSTFSGATIDANEQVTAFGSAQTLFKYDLKGANSIDETNPNSRENGTSYFETSGTIVLKKQSLATRKELKLMSYERLHIIAEDYNGNFKLYGFQNGCEVQVDTSGGAAMGDLSGYTLTITAQEQQPAHFVDSTIIGDTINTTVTVGT